MKLRRDEGMEKGGGEEGVKDRSKEGTKEEVKTGLKEERNDKKGMNGK